MSSKYTAPEGYKQAAEDVSGYWDPDDGPIHCIPRGAKIFDGNIDKTKPSTLLLCELVGNQKMRLAKPDGAPKDTKGDLVELPSGTIVGVWGKPGMKAIRNLADCKVFMYQEGEKDTKKPNPMKLFKITFTGPGNKQIPVLEDTRDKSADVRTMLAGPKNVSRSRPSDNTGATDDDNIPF